MGAVSIWTCLLITHFTGVGISIDEIPSWQQTSGKCNMVRIDARIENRNSDRAVRPSSSVDLMSQRQVNLFWCPLRDEHSVVAPDAPGIAYAPCVATTDGWCGNKIRLNKHNPRIISQLVYAIIEDRKSTRLNSSHGYIS